LIKSADMDSNFSDIATALTQSLATTGVSTMSGPFKAAAGAVAAPGITFNGAPATGFYLAGTNQIGWASNGVVGATFNSDTSMNFAGNVAIAGILTALKGSIPVGAVVDFAGATAPAGWLLCFGQLISTTTYSLLFTALSTTYGSGSGTFGIPDYRGRATFGQDNMGGSAANRITATVNFDGTILGNSGGGQSSTLGTSNLPPYTPTGSINISLGGSTPNVVLTPGATVGVGGTNSGGQLETLAAALAGGFTFAGGAQGGSNAAFTNMSPAIIANKIIYAGV
jgi:microcystin-dependent protein